MKSPCGDESKGRDDTAVRSRRRHEGHQLLAGRIARAAQVVPLAQAGDRDPQRARDLEQRVATAHHVGALAVPRG